jgi:hypothetical protein
MDDFVAEQQRQYFNSMQHALDNRPGGLTSIYQSSSATGFCTGMAQVQHPMESEQVFKKKFEQLQPKKGKSMFSEIATDIKTFIMEHRGVIYFIALALLVDHLFFAGAFRARLQAMADKMVAKVEQKIAA